MNTPTKIAAFAVGLVAVFGAAVGVGSAVGPVGPTTTADGSGPEPSSTGAHGDGGHTAAPPGPADLPAGSSVTDDGYTLALAEGTVQPGPATLVSFSILGPDGSPVTGYRTEHDVDLHLIAVRRDLAGYQHVHPELGADGVWEAPLALEPGSWRLFADFTATADGENRVLGADLAVPGNHDPVPLAAPSAMAEVDGFTVVRSGGLVPGTESELTFSVSRDGVPVVDLQPYLGAYGHLVALRAGDLAYLHVHPAGQEGTEPAPGPHVRFAATTPSAGTYRLFLDFRHGNAVHTAAFTVTAGEPPAGPDEEHGS